MWAQSGCTNPAFLGPTENAEKKLSILSMNTWGDRFSQPL